MLSAQPQISSLSDFQYRLHLKSSALGLFFGLSIVPIFTSASIS